MRCHQKETFDVQLPPHYVVLDCFPWQSQRKWHMQFIDMQMDPFLINRIQSTLDRMPNTTGPVGISYSGGKDSQAIFLLAAMKYKKEQLFAMFADTDDEWPQTYQAIDQFERWIDVEIARLPSVGIHQLLRVEKPFWPKLTMRHCTKDLKMLPQRDFLDQQGYAQVRIRGGHQFRSGISYEPQHDAPLLFVGERWAEGGSRSQLPFDEREPMMLRYVHRPVLDWSIADIWQFLFAMQAPINEVYLLGVQRAACAGCVFAKPEELVLLYDHYPEHFYRWLETEQIIGHPRPGKSLASIYDFIQMRNAFPSERFSSVRRGGQLSLF